MLYHEGGMPTHLVEGERIAVVRSRAFGRNNLWHLYFVGGKLAVECECVGPSGPQVGNPILVGAVEAGELLRQQLDGFILELQRNGQDA